MAYKRTNRLLRKRNESKINIILTRSPVMGEHNKRNDMKELENHQQEIESSRVGGFGGSDAAMFLRIAKKGGVEGLSNSDLYRIAVAMGIKPYVPVSPTEAMNNGHTFEDSYARYLDAQGKPYQREVKLIAECQPANFHIFAHADFVFREKVYKKPNKIVLVHECKFIADEEKTADDVAETYKAQLQWYYLLGAEYVNLIRGYGDPEHPHTQNLAIDEDENIIDELKLGIRLLDEAISDGWEPNVEAEFASDMSKKMQNIIADYERLKFEKNAIDEKLEELQKQIIEYMSIGNVFKISGSLGTITRTADSVVESFDSKKFEKENPDLYKNYIKKSTRKGSIRYTMNKL